MSDSLERGMMRAYCENEIAKHGRRVDSFFPAVLRVLADLELAEGVLKRVEFVSDSEHGEYCPSCYGDPPWRHDGEDEIHEGHLPDCELARHVSPREPEVMAPRLRFEDMSPEQQEHYGRLERQFLTPHPLVELMSADRERRTKGIQSFLHAERETF